MGIPKAFHGECDQHLPYLASAPTPRILSGSSCPTTPVLDPHPSMHSSIPGPIMITGGNMFCLRQNLNVKVQTRVGRKGNQEWSISLLTSAEMTCYELGFGTNLMTPPVTNSATSLRFSLLRHSRPRMPDVPLHSQTQLLPLKTN